jgi:hypothetical protein
MAGDDQPLLLGAVRVLFDGSIRIPMSVQALGNENIVLSSHLKIGSNIQSLTISHRHSISTVEGVNARYPLLMTDLLLDDMHHFSLVE